MICAGWRDDRFVYEDIESSLVAQRIIFREQLPLYCRTRQAWSLYFPHWYMLYKAYAMPSKKAMYEKK